MDIHQLVFKKEVISQQMLYGYVAIAVLCTVLIMCCVFSIYHHYQKQKLEILKLRSLVQVRKEQEETPVIMEEPHQKSGGNQVNISLAKWENVRIQRKVWKDPESFDNAMRNSVSVQDAVLQDIHEQMETEGQMNEGIPQTISE